MNSCGKIILIVMPITWGGNPGLCRGDSLSSSMDTFMTLRFLGKHGQLPEDPVVLFSLTMMGLYLEL